jgi:hypothetical protein
MGTPSPYAWSAGRTQTNPCSIPDKTLLYGIELEIEGVHRDMVVDGMRVETDGSLRNNGLEFITEPMRLADLEVCLTTFFNKNKLNENNYSERTSIHVHTNCSDLEPHELANVCVLYQVFEKVLFNFIGDDRESNIFCVPWSETMINYQLVTLILKHDIRHVRDWYKYTALNLQPLSSYGTIEWRHMSGHCDVNKIILWCQLIGSIYKFSRNKQFAEVREHIISLNTTSQYREIIDLVFGEYAAALRGPGYQLAIEDGVLNMKYSLAEPKLRNKKSADEFQWFVPQEAPPAQTAAQAVFLDAVRQRPIQRPATIIMDDITTEVQF